MYRIECPWIFLYRFVNLLEKNPSDILVEELWISSMKFHGSSSGMFADLHIEKFPLFDQLATFPAKKSRTHMRTDPTEY